MFQALVKLFLDLQEKHCRGLIQASVRPADVVHTIQVKLLIVSHFVIAFWLIFLKLLLADLPSSAGLLEIAPVYKRQQESWDKVFFLEKQILQFNCRTSWKQWIYCASGPENPLSSVAVGHPAGKGTCHRDASQVLFTLISRKNNIYSCLQHQPPDHWEERFYLHTHFHLLYAQEEHPPAGGSDGPTHNPGRLTPPPLRQQEQHTQNPGMYYADHGFWRNLFLNLDWTSGFLWGWRTKGWSLPIPCCCKSLGWMWGKVTTFVLWWKIGFASFKYLLLQAECHECPWIHPPPHSCLSSQLSKGDRRVAPGRGWPHGHEKCTGNDTTLYNVKKE